MYLHLRQVGYNVKYPRLPLNIVFIMIASYYFLCFYLYNVNIIVVLIIKGNQLRLFF